MTNMTLFSTVSTRIGDNLKVLLGIARPSFDVR